MNKYLNDRIFNELFLKQLNLLILKQRIITLINIK